MNLFTGLSTNEIISFFLSVAEFSGFAGLVAFSLYAFWVASAPVHGRVRSAAVWHIVALQFFMVSIITAVWSAPAEKSFVSADDGGLLELGRLARSLADAVTNLDPALFFGSPQARLAKVVVGLVSAGVGLVCMAIGARAGGAQKRRLRDGAATAAPHSLDRGAVGSAAAVSAGRS